MDVVKTAWTAAGNPSQGRFLLRGSCARCAASGQLRRVDEVVSKTFTALDEWRDPRGKGLCPGCAWAYQTPHLRNGVHLVRQRPATLRLLTRAEAAETLGAGALPSDATLVVPLRPGRKHVLPAARWGRVAVDDTCLPWNESDAARLNCVRRLRRAGFGSRMLTSAAPAYGVLRLIPRQLWPDVLSDWENLRPWRSPDNQWFVVAVHLTTPTKESNP
jgi:hypothetical protein